MISKKQIIEEIQRLFRLKDLVESYEEIASMRMRRIRGGVIVSRDYITELTSIYQELSLSYKEQIINLMQSSIGKGKVKSMHKHNGRTISVYLSANTRLYGDIVQKTFKEFLLFTEKNPSDILIIGKYGKSLFEEEQPKKEFIYIDLPDFDMDRQNLTSLLTLLTSYENVYIFYGRFESMTSQRAVMLDVYGEATSTGSSKVRQTRYLFEPSLQKILQFFEETIFATIVQQTFKESELAKFASRMIALDDASQNIKLDLKKVNLQERIVKHRMMDKKQVEALSGMSLWNIR